MKSPLQVRKYYFTNISVKVNEKPKKGADKGKRAVNFQTTIETKNDNDNNYLVVLSLSLTPDDDGPGFPYSIEMIVEGHFSIAPNWPEDEKEKLVITNGGAILISAAREQIANLTGRSKHGQFLLPAVDLNSFLHKEEEDQQE